LETGQLVVIQESELQDEEEKSGSTREDTVNLYDDVYRLDEVSSTITVAEVDIKTARRVAQEEMQRVDKPSQVFIRTSPKTKEMVCWFAKKYKQKG
jgi:hypothetical protein